MSLRIRPARDDDRDAVVEAAARAWAPVFASVNSVLGPELAERLHGRDWRVHHEAELDEILGAEGTTAWVAELDGRAVGFAAARVVDPVRRIGEVQIVGVDPDAQRRGVGTALTLRAEAWLREQSMRVAFIGTGGDEGHAPARRLYGELGYQPFPVVQYYKVLDPRD